jgi:hypothetical protein
MRRYERVSIFELFEVIAGRDGHMLYVELVPIEGFDQMKASSHFSGSYAADIVQVHDCIFALSS